MGNGQVKPVCTHCTGGMQTGNIQEDIRAGQKRGDFSIKQVTVSC